MPIPAAAPALSLDREEFSEEADGAVEAGENGEADD